MELCITVPLSPRTPRWRDRTTEGSKASGCFVMRSRNALNNKQTGHCMPSSQDVLPSASTLTWIWGKKNGVQGPLIAIPILLLSPACSRMVACVLPCARSARFLTALRKRHRVRERCLPCPALVSFPAVTQGEGEDFMWRRKQKCVSRFPLQAPIRRRLWQGIKSQLRDSRYWSYQVKWYSG